MTVIERAIESAKCRIYRVKANNGQSELHQKKAEDQIELMNVTIEALEKQIPKKPIYKDYKEDDEGEKMIPHKAECPICGYEFEFGTWNDEDNHYCKCGQKIDWGNEK